MLFPTVLVGSETTTQTSSIPHSTIERQHQARHIIKHTLCSDPICNRNRYRTSRYPQCTAASDQRKVPQIPKRPVSSRLWKTQRTKVEQNYLTESAPRTTVYPYIPSLRAELGGETCSCSTCVSVEPVSGFVDIASAMDIDVRLFKLANLS